jgi:hypothetical protein
VVRVLPAAVRRAARACYPCPRIALRAATAFPAHAGPLFSPGTERRRRALAPCSAAALHGRRRRAAPPLVPTAVPPSRCPP